MALLDGKQLRGGSTSLDKLQGHSGLVTFTASATMSFLSGSVLRTSDANILDGLDVVNKNYVDSVASGLNPKESARLVYNGDAAALTGFTYSNGASGVGAVVQFTSGQLATIDGVALTTGDRVIMNSSTDQYANGIYVYGPTNSYFTRSVDFDGSPTNEVDGGEYAFVTEGVSYADTGWVLQSPDGVATFGVSSIIWVQFSSAGVINAGDGLYQIGNNFHVGAGTGITVSGNSVTIADTSVSANSYGSAGSVGTFTVNAQGQLTAASNTTIDITASQVSDFNTAAETAIFSDANFVDGVTVQFDVTAGASTTAEVVNGSLTASKLNSTGGATAGYILSANADGTFAWIANIEGDIFGVTAGSGLTGGGDTGFITLDVNTNNGVEVNADYVGLGGTLVRNTTIDGSAYDLTIGNVDYLLFTASTFDVEVSGLISLDAGTGSVQILGDDSITISASNSVDLSTNGDLTFVANSGTVTTANGLGLVYTSDYSGGFVTHSLVTKSWVDTQLSSLGDITGVTAGNGLSGGGASGYVTLDVNLGVNSGLTFSGDDIIIDTTIAGNGLDFASGVLTVNTSEINTALAGSGLTANGSALDINVNADSLEITGDVVRLKDTITGARTFANNVTVQGNLTVEGTQTVVNTENLYIEDNIITLNATYSGPGNVVDAGLEVNHGNGTYSALIWDASAGYWAAGLSGSTSIIVTEAGNGLTKTNNTLAVDLTTIAEQLQGNGLSASGGDINIIGGSGITVNADSIEVDYTAVAEQLQGNGLSASGGDINIIGGSGITVNTDSIEVDYTAVASGLQGQGLTSSGGVLNVDLTVDGGLTFSGAGETGTIQVSVDGSTIQIVNGQLVATTAGDISGVTAGNGLSGGGSSGFITLDVNLGVNSGLTFSGDDIIIDTTIAGNGLDFASGVLTVNTGEINTALAGDGLVANGNALDVNAANGIEISGDAVQLASTVAGGGLTYSAGVLSLSSQPYYGQRNLVPSTTSGDDQSTGLSMSFTPSDYSGVSVYVNGQLQYLGNGTTSADCYFGTQSGSAVSITAVEVGMTLYWNQTESGYNLSSSSDKVDIVYGK